MKDATKASPSVQPTFPPDLNTSDTPTTTPWTPGSLYCFGSPVETEESSFHHETHSLTPCLHLQSSWDNLASAETTELEPLGPNLDPDQDIVIQVDPDWVSLGPDGDQDVLLVLEDDALPEVEVVPRSVVEEAGDKRDLHCSLIQQEAVDPAEAYACESAHSSGERRAPYTLSTRDQRRCEKLTLMLFCHRLSAPFHEAVSPLAHNYYQIIKRPMDLSVIRRKLDHSNTLHYFTAQHFVDDTLLMFRNCATFNYPDSEVAHAGRDLEVFFLEQLHQIFSDQTFPTASQEKTNQARLHWLKCCLSSADNKVSIATGKLSPPPPSLRGRRPLFSTGCEDLGVLDEPCWPPGMPVVPVSLVGNKRDLCQEVSMAEGFQDIASVFTKLIQHVMENHLKYRGDHCPYGRSKSMAKLINNVFGKRRKSSTQCFHRRT
ncbi:hypothetical protein CRUP_027782 [Coryphaenoides rupestris]|nr:hypothetical protein CRUP_027782 [Coryphaenoides rupestris]